MKTKQDLKSLTRNEIIKWFEKKGFKSFRANQVYNWVYKNGIDKYSKMTNLPGKLVEELANNSFLSNLTLIEKDLSSDGTTKYLWKLKDGETIESVYLPYEDGRHSVCISTQVGCAMNCQFCATGLSGLVRNLTPGEIVDQVLQIQKDISKKEFGLPRISNIVFMGMGEPLANFESLLKAIFIINDKKGLGIGMRKMTLSTSGLVNKIKELADLELQIGLAISLNAPNDKLRNKLMPINKKYPLRDLLNAAHYYINKTGRRITFEYVMMKNINDFSRLAYQTAELLEGMLCHVNLIPINPVPEFNLERPSIERVNKFKDILISKGIETTVRQERGKNIEAACGQLRRLKG